MEKPKLVEAESILGLSARQPTASSPLGQSGRQPADLVADVLVRVVVLWTQYTFFVWGLRSVTHTFDGP